MILLITGTFDDECDAVVKALKASGNKAFFRLNADRLYDFYFVDVDLASNAFTLRHRYTGQTLHSHEVKTVWWARYTLPAATWEFFDAHLSA